VRRSEATTPKLPSRRKKSQRLQKTQKWSKNAKMTKLPKLTFGAGSKGTTNWWFLAN